ncbi:ISAs1 family transposase [Streptomyces griseomycini]|uniref:ISAs1 family transposase n=1 Tax=Streptomyces griseomycini TaxID=66895 RepID=UPI001985A507|nr:ISAs1 family transposase [Streptomyces griseomycini]GGQ35383.1 ISAs1 family transposase [Streptomyces griseomycini]
MPSCLEQLGNFSGSVAPETATDLRAYLNEVPCPRARRGIRHPWTALLTAAAAAVLVGAASMAVIGEWGADAPQRVLARLGFRPDPLTGLIRPPQPTAIRLGLAAVNDDALDRAIGRFLQERNSPPTSRRAVAVDGKTLWGSRTKDQPATALIAAMTHQGDVLAQMQVDGKRNEIQAFAPLLDGIDLTGAVITADALRTQHDHASYLHERGTHYLAVVKRNHPTLHERARRLPWRAIRLDRIERTRAHHHNEIRRLKTAAFAHIDYPHARQVLQVVRWRRDLGSGKLTIERIYLVTSLPPGVARPPAAHSPRGSAAAGRSRTSSTTSAAAPSVRTPRRSVPGTCPA